MKRAVGRETGAIRTRNALPHFVPNPVEATQVNYKANLKVLVDYFVHSTGNPRDVVQKIRPVVEDFSKHVSANSFTDGDTLGDILGKIRQGRANASTI